MTDRTSLKETTRHEDNKKLFDLNKSKLILPKPPYTKDELVKFNEDGIRDLSTNMTQERRSRFESPQRVTEKKGEKPRFFSLPPRKKPSGFCAVLAKGTYIP